MGSFMFRCWVILPVDIDQDDWPLLPRKRSHIYHISTPNEDSLKGGEQEPEPKGGVMVRPKTNVAHTSRAWE
jgi:hypothetical protein